VKKILADSASDGDVSKAMLPSWLLYIIAKWGYGVETVLCVVESSCCTALVESLADDG
jgi:hypothetical protein